MNPLKLLVLWTALCPVLSIGNNNHGRTLDTGLNCMLGEPQDPEAPILPTTVSYYYALETSGPLDPMRKQSYVMPIEDKIMAFLNLHSTTLWCYGQNRRRDRILRVGGRRQEEEDRSRRLEIVSLSSTPSDQPIDLDCPYSVDSSVDNCEPYHGRMFILSHENDDLTYITESIQQAIKRAMDENLLLGSDIPTVSKIVYLGATESEAFSVGTTGVGEVGGSSDEDGPDQERGPIVAGIVDQEPADNDSRFRARFVLAIPFIGAILILFFLARKRRIVTARELVVDTEETNGILIGTGDPPGAFHQGRYHYMRDGQRYLSTNCESCHETRTFCWSAAIGGDVGAAFSVDDSSAQMSTDNDLPTITEEDEEDMTYRSTLVPARSKNLALRHSCMDVHGCSSATCATCRRDPDREVQFVSSPKNGTSFARPFRPRPEDGDFETVQVGRLALTNAPHNFDADAMTEV